MAVGQIVGLGAAVLIPLALSLIDTMQGDPEADVATALQRLQRQQVAEVSTREYVKAKGAERIEQAGRFPLSKIATTAEAYRQGYIGPEDLGGWESPPDEGGGLVERVASQLGKSPRELKARLDPRRLGINSGLTRATLYAQEQMEGMR